MLIHQLLIDGAHRRPERIAYRWVDRDRALTYTQAVAEMERMAGALAHLGVGKGDRVTIFAHNGLDYLNAMFGAWRIGAISALVNVKFADELPYYFADHTPSVVVYTHDMGEAVRRAAAGAPSVRHLICMDGPQEGAHSLPALMAAGFTPGPDPGDETAVAHLSYTSGTTGKPKGACLRHEPTVRATRCIAERLRISPDDVSFGPTALSSSYQLVGNLMPPLGRGATLHVMGRWTQTTGYDAMEAAGASLFIANPTLLQEVLAESRLRGRAPGRLRLGLSGGGPVPPTLKKAWRDELKLPLVESFGQSELGGFMALGLPELEPDDAKLMRVGPPLPDKEVRIVDARDRELPIGQVGQIVLRGGFMWGYWGKPEKTEEATRGGWLRTGDLGVMDEDGYITMRGRRSELIRVAGVDWFPRDIEEALGGLPGVKQAALVGLPDSALGARPVAVLTLDGAFDAEAAKAAIARLLPYDLAPLEIRIRDSLPIDADRQDRQERPCGGVGAMRLPSRHWWDLTTAEFAALDMSQVVALQPVGAVEQHGPHLPVRVDAAINAGIVARALQLMPEDLPLLALPPLPVGKSNEHSAFPGSLTLSYETLGRVWYEIGESVRRAGCRKILFFNSHGGQPQLLDIVCRELRVKLDMFAVACSWFNIVDLSGRFEANELKHGIHAGAIETGMMLHLHRDLVDMGRAQNFVSAAEAVEADNEVLRSEGAVGFGWQTQDLNAWGACGDATIADAAVGAEIVESAAAALAKLAGEVARYPLERVKATTAYGAPVKT